MNIVKTIIKIGFVLWSAYLIYIGDNFTQLIVIAVWVAIGMYWLGYDKGQADGKEKMLNHL